MIPRTVWLPAVALVVVGGLVWDRWQSDREHHDFFEDVRGFIEAGPRNTAEDGYVLCQAINQLLTFARMHQDVDVELELIDCEKRYREDPVKKVPRLEHVPVE